MANVKSNTSIPYDPMAPIREEKVGKLKVKGNDSFSTVCKVGLLDAAIKQFDNTDKDADPAVPSAFERAKAWAAQNQDKGGTGGIFG